MRYHDGLILIIIAVIIILIIIIIIVTCAHERLNLPLFIIIISRRYHDDIMIARTERARSCVEISAPDAQPDGRLCRNVRPRERYPQEVQPGRAANGVGRYRREPVEPRRLLEARLLRAEAD